MFEFNQRWITAGISARVLCLFCVLSRAQPVTTDDRPWQDQVRIADELQIKGDYQQAETILLSLLKNATRLQLKAVDFVLIRNDLGGLYLELGRYTDAERHLQRNFATLSNSSAEHKLEWLRTANNLVSLYTGIGELSRAAAIGELAVRTSKAMQDGYPLDYAHALHHLAITYYFQRRYRQAESLLRDALRLQQDQGRSEGADAELMYALVSMSSVFLRTAQSEEALACVVRARQIGERVFSPNHVVVSRALIVEASVYRSMGRTADAEIAAQRAMAIVQDGPRPILQAALEEYAHVLKQARRKAEAKAAEKRARKIREDLQRDNPARHRFDVTSLADR